MGFHDAQTPEDLPPHCQGEPIEDDSTEADDDALTTWLGGRQPNLPELEDPHESQ